MRFAAVFLALSLPALAEQAAWNFRKGTVWTWEAETSFEWSVSKTGKRTLQQRQVETITMRLEVDEVDAEGVATIRGTITSVHVKNTASQGTAEWDSSEKKISEHLGFKRFEKLLGTAFTAKVGSDGRVVEAKGAGTPDRAETEATASEQEEIPAQAMHVPTSPRTWLELVFGPVPPAKKGERRAIRFLEEEQVAVTFERMEKEGGRNCARLELETPDRAPTVDAKDLFADETSDPNGLAWAAVRLARKKGEAWFARPGGHLVKLSVAADAGFGYDGRTLAARMTWELKLKGVELGK